MDINDIFGRMPNRPSDSADFWRLSELILALDASTEGRRTQEGADRMSIELDKHIDKEAAYYMAFQRAIRIVGAGDPFSIMMKFDEIARLSTLYLEGMLMGMRFSEAGGHREPGTSGPTEENS